MSDNIGNMVVRVAADTENFTAGMQRVRDGIDQTARKLSDTAETTRNFSEKMSDLGKNMMAAGGILSATVTTPLVGLGAAAITTAGQLEQARIAFGTLLGGAEKAAEMLERLKEFAATTPFEFPELVEATKRMMALGFSAEQIVPTLRTVGDAVAALGGSAELLDRIILALGQMQAKGTVTAEEMKQLAEAGIPAWQILAEAIGVSIPEAMDLVKKRAVEASEAVPAILAGMNERFGGMMKQQSETLLGQWSNFKDQVTFALQDVGAALIPFAKSVLEAMRPVLQAIGDLARAFAELPRPVQDVIIYAGLFAAALGPVLIAIGSLAAALPTVVGALGLLTAAKTAAIGVFATFGTAVSNIVFALQTNMVGALTAGEAMLLRLGQAAMLAAAAFVGWKLGEWLYENVPAVRALGDAIGDVIDKVTGLGTALSHLTGAQKQVAKANENLEFAVKKLEERLKEKGIQVERGSLSLEDYAKKLQDMVKSMSKAPEETKKATDATIKLKESAKDAAKAQREWEKALDKWRDTTAKARSEAFMKDTTTKALILTLKDVGDKYKRAEEFIVQYKARLMEGRTATSDMDRMAQEFDKTLDAVTQSFGDLSSQIRSAPWPQLASELSANKTRAGDLEKAFKDLGITSANVFSEKRRLAEEAYKTIKDSGIATAEELKKAELAYLEAVRREQEALTGKVNDEIDKRIRALKTEAPEFAKEYRKALDDVSTAISNTTQKMVGMLIGIESGSVMDALKELGRGIVSKLVEPWMDALGDLIERGIKKLISWLISETGLMGAVKAAGAAIAGLFSGGGAAAGAAAGGAAAGGSAAGGAAAGGAAAGGGILAGALGASLIGGAVAGGLSMIGSIIGAKMLSGDMGKVEENTRYTAVALIGSQGVIDLLWGLSDHFYKVRELIIEMSTEGIGKLTGQMDYLIADVMQPMLQTARDLLGSLDNMSQFGIGKLTGQIDHLLINHMEPIHAAIMDIRQAALAAREQDIVVAVDGREIARAVMRYMEGAGVTP